MLSPLAPPPAPPPAPPLAAEAVARLRRIGGDDLLLRLLAVFAEHVPARLRDAEAARAGGGPGAAAAVVRACHAIKSSAAQVGALALAEACERVEAVGRMAPDDARALDEPFAAVRRAVVVALASADATAAAARAPL